MSDTLGRVPVPEIIVDSVFPAPSLASRLRSFRPRGCPYSQQGGLDVTHFPGASPFSCDKGYETPNGRLAHGMKRYFGAEPQGVRIKLPVAPRLQPPDGQLRR